MPEYRRIKLPNACYFFTVVTYKRKPLFNSEIARNILHQSFKSIREKHPFQIEGIVLLPDHLHTIWSLPYDETNYSLRWNLIKNRFTRLYVKHENVSTTVNESRKMKREQGIWQRRFWEHFIRDDTDFKNHLDYIHYNPVKHGYVKSPYDWERSSFSRYVKIGWYDKDWGSSQPTNLIQDCVGE